MPVHKTKGGYQYGNTGKVYKDKKKAIKQAIAIAYSKARQRGKKPSQEDIAREIKGEDTVKKVSSAELNKQLLLMKTAVGSGVEVIHAPKPAREDYSGKPSGGWTEIGSSQYDPRRIRVFENSVNPVDDSAFVQFDRGRIAEAAKRLEANYLKRYPGYNRAVIARMAVRHAYESARERAQILANARYTQDENGNVVLREDLPYKDDDRIAGETVHIRSGFDFNRTRIPMDRLSKAELKAMGEGRIPKNYTYGDRYNRLRKQTIVDEKTGEVRAPTPREIMRTMVNLDMAPVSKIRGGLDIVEDPYNGKISQQTLNALFGSRFPVPAENSPLNGKAPIIERGPIERHVSRDTRNDKKFDWSDWQYNIGLGVGPALYHVPRFFTKTIPEASSNMWWRLKNLFYKAPTVKEWEK